MKTSLIITTYNWEEALSCVLHSVLKQTDMPDEVIIADDGSRTETRHIITRFQSKFPVPLIHSWQEDLGFRAARSRNIAIAKASYDYLIFIDGDMILDKNFIHDHKKIARTKQLVQGSRVITNKNSANKIMHGSSPNLFMAGLSNRVNAIPSQFLMTIFSKRDQKLKGSKTCNMAFWKEDAIAINGFNEDFIGWGREDSEFVARMLNSNTIRYKVKFACIAFHLFHNECNKTIPKENDEILSKTVNKSLKHCTNGVKNHL